MLQSYFLCGEILFYIIAATFIICAIKYLSLRIGYYDSIYHKNTKRRFHKVLFDKGAHGEYLTSNELKDINPSGLFLFNAYLPKNNDETTELDVILIHQSGIYVFESKNYSGWIFGTETQREWTQTLNSEGKIIKNHFLNPIMQNELHIKWLKSLLPDYPDMVYHSMILFSDRCTLKKIKLETGKSLVMNRHQVQSFVSHSANQTGIVLSPQAMKEVYDRLYPYTQVSDVVKQKHIDDNIVKHTAKRMGLDQSNLQPEAIPVKTKQIKTESVIHKEVSPKISKPSSEKDARVTVKAVKLCPICGKKMVLRTATKGKRAGNQFWGCSGFPHCRYTEDIKEPVQIE